ncbi:MAG TPA: hypothetical protein VNT01_00450 [Symbiobacteriaceae bacterium]|nr:hypothetical protein [Symbiobacteriaceae bacterium]
MIEYLEQLVEAGKSREALKVAEMLLSRDGTSSRDLLVINSAQVVSHCRLEEWEEALVAGDVTMKLAKESGEWDIFGIVSIHVAVAYSRLRQYEDAISRIYEYLSGLPNYTKSETYEALAWYNLGLFLSVLDKHEDAATALCCALAAAMRAGNDRYAHGIRQALIEAYLRSGDLLAVVRLLAQSAHYLRRNPRAHMWHDSWAFHMKLRAEFALATGRSVRAGAVAVRALEKTIGEPEHECRFHLILAKVASGNHRSVDALGHALAARSCAVRSARRDLEAEATDMVYELSVKFPDAAASVDSHYLPVP